MNNFLHALQEKITLLQDEKEELEDALSRVSAKLAVLEELLQEEQGKGTASVPPPKKRGRPPKAQKAEADPVWAEASKMEGTDPAIAARLSKRTFSPSPREAKSYGPGINADQGQKRHGKHASNATITVEEDSNDVPVSGE